LEEIKVPRLASSQTFGCCVKATVPQCSMSSGEVDNEDGGGEKSVASSGMELVPDKDAGRGGGGVDGGIEWPYDDKDVEEEEVVADDIDDLADDMSRLAFDQDRVLVVEGDGVTAAPDGGWGWMIVFVSFLCASVVDGMCSVFGVLLPDLVTHFDRPSSTVAIAGSLLAGGFLLYGIPCSISLP